MEEIWKDIKDWEGLYQVSNLGRVKSFKYNKIRILKLSKTSKGYFNVCLMNKKPYPVLLHRLIAEAFIPNFEKKTCINHINGIKDDNRFENLEISSQSEHMKKHKLPIGQWSRHYEFCLKCGTTERKHAGNGYCTKCNMYLRSVEKRGYETEYDENGKRIFSESHREKLKETSILREKNKKYKDCCLQYEDNL